MKINDIVTYIKDKGPDPIQLLALLAEELNKYFESYVGPERDIINDARGIYARIFRITVTDETQYPVYLRYLQVNDNRKYPALKLEDKRISLDSNRFGNNEIEAECKTILNRLFQYYNKYQVKHLSGNSKPILHIFQLFIEIVYVFTNADLDSTNTLRQVEDYLKFIEEIMYMPKLKHKWHEDHDTDAKNVLAHVQKELEDIRKIIIAWHSRKSARDYLKELRMSLKNLCHEGFNAALRFCPNYMIEAIVDLNSIKREKEKPEITADHRLRRYAIQSEKSSISEEFIYHLSCSLMNLFKEQKHDVNGFYVNVNAIEKLADKKSDIYPEFKQEKFLKHYIIFCMCLENLALLRKHVIIGEKISSEGGNLSYFILSERAAVNLIQNIKIVISNLTAAYENLLVIGRARKSTLSYHGMKETQEDRGWSDSFGQIISVIGPQMQLKISNIKDVCAQISALHHTFEQNVQIKIFDLLKECSVFDNDVKSFRSYLIKNTLLTSNYSQEPVVSLAPIQHEEKTQPAMKSVTYLFENRGRFIVNWSYLKDAPVIDHLNSLQNTFRDQLGVEKFSHLTAFNSAEEFFIENKIDNTSDIINKFLEIYRVYLKADNILRAFKAELKKSKTNKGLLDFVYYFRLELAYSLIRLIVQNIHKNNMDIDDSIKNLMNKISKEFKERASDSKKTDNAARSAYKTALHRWSDKMKDASKQVLLDLISVKEDNAIYHQNSLAMVAHNNEEKKEEKEVANNINNVGYRFPNTVYPDPQVAQDRSIQYSDESKQNEVTPRPQSNSNYSVYAVASSGNSAEHPEEKHPVSTNLSNVPPLSSSEPNINLLSDTMQKIQTLKAFVDQLNTEFSKTNNSMNLISREREALKIVQNVFRKGTTLIPNGEVDHQIYCQALLSTLIKYRIESVENSYERGDLLCRMINQVDAWAIHLKEKSIGIIHSQGFMSTCKDIWHYRTQAGRVAFSNPKAKISDQNIFKELVRKDCETALTSKHINISKDDRENAFPRLTDFKL